MKFLKNIFFLISALTISYVSDAQSSFLCLEFPLPIDMLRFKENKLNRITLKYQFYNTSSNEPELKNKLKAQVLFFVFQNKIVKGFGSNLLLNRNSFSIYNQDKNSEPKIYYTGKRIYRIDCFDKNNQANGMYLYTYNEYKLLKRIFFYKYDSNGDLMLSERIDVTYH